ISNHEGRPPVPERFYVDAFSGKDGRPLWWWHVATPTDRFAVIWPLRWWGRGPDGWPLLAVALGSRNPQLRSPVVVYNLEAATGRNLSTAVGLFRPGVADLDGDGLTDLWGEAEGQLRAVRGEAPEAWRALGGFGPAAEFPQWTWDTIHPAADLDGDGIADTMIASPRAPNPTATDAIASHALGPSLDQGFPPASAPAMDRPGSRTAIARS